MVRERLGTPVLYRNAVAYYWKEVIDNIDLDSLRILDLSSVMEFRDLVSTPVFASLGLWCSRRRCNPTLKTSELVKIRAKSVAICEHICKIAVCALNLQKWHPKSKCWRFFGEFRLKWCFDFKKWAHEKKCSRFWGHFSGVFFGQVKGNLGKIPSHTQKFANSGTYGLGQNPIALKLWILQRYGLLNFCGLSCFLPAVFAGTK